MPRISECELENAKEWNVHEEFRDYALVEAYSTSVHVKGDKPKYSKEDKTDIKQLVKLKGGVPSNEAVIYLD